MEHRIIQGDVMDGLRSLPDGCVQCTVTSPPYYGLRNYGVDGQIGLEETPEQFIQKMVEVFREVRKDLIERVGIHELDIESTAMGQSGCDLYLSKAARDLFPFGVECKNKEALKIWAAIEQCEANAKEEGLRPLLVFRRNRTEARAVLPWTDFCAIWNEVLALRKRVKELEASP